MAEIINLRIARKAKKRSDRMQAAAANRARFGQSKQARLVHEQERDRADQALDGAKRERD